MKDTPVPGDSLWEQFRAKLAKVGKVKVTGGLTIEMTEGMDGDPPLAHFDVKQISRDGTRTHKTFWRTESQALDQGAALASAVTRALSDKQKGETP